MKEQHILNTILEFFDKASIPAIHVRNTGSIFRRPDGSLRFGRAKHEQKGAADIVLSFKGIPWAIEVKSENGYLRHDQAEWKLKWLRHGGQYVVARSLEDVLQAFGMSQRL